MVSCKLLGRIGNQFFIIASTIALAKRNGVNYLIPNQSINPSVWGTYFEFEQVTFSPQSIAHETSPKYHPIPYSEGMVLEGYFQALDYFSDYLDDVKKALKFNNGERINKVAVHVRRGDYQQLNPKEFPVVTKEYLKEAMEMFNSEFTFFSDDIAWCKENFPGHSYSEGQSEKGDIHLMSRHEHFILSASTFGAMAAILSDSPNKIVVVPKDWGVVYFGQNIPKSWVKL